MAAEMRAFVDHGAAVLRVIDGAADGGVDIAEDGGRENGVPNGIRTRVATLKEWSPRPLDDGDL